MDEPPRPHGSGGHPGAGPTRGSTTGTPDWVKVFGIIATIVVLLLVILLLTGGPGGGGHGPGRHLSSGDLSGQSPLPSLVADLTLSAGATDGQALFEASSG